MCRPYDGGTEKLRAGGDPSGGYKASFALCLHMQTQSDDAPSREFDDGAAAQATGGRDRARAPDRFDQLDEGSRLSSDEM